MQSASTQLIVNQMPELPEVETCKRGIEPHILNTRIKHIIVRHTQLRWPIPNNLAECLVGQRITEIQRRAKYLLLITSTGVLLIHLGMSGSLRIIPPETDPQKHDHVDIVFSAKCCLRYNDPRRFGAMLWIEQPWQQHKLLKHLGVEPLERAFSAQYLLQQSRHKKLPLKTFIMNQKIVVGVGNIYANEALFLANLHPQLPAQNLTLSQCQTLTNIIKKVLRQAIQRGGTTLRDFVNTEGKPGYFQQSLQVYGRGGQACRHCNSLLEEIRLGQRSTVFCPGCQPLISNSP